MKKATVLSAVLVVASSLAFGQVNTASLTGLVTDPSGAPVSDANVTLTNTATNVAQTTQTGAAGYYEFPVIQVGTYKLKVELIIAGCTCLRDRKSTRLNSSHTVISYAVFCLKKKKSRQTK